MTNLVDRRGFVVRAATGLAAIGAGLCGQMQRVGTTVGGVLSYRLSEGQTSFTLLTLDGTFLKPNQVERVLGDFRHGAVTDLLPGQYLIEYGELRVIPQVAEWLDGLIVLHH